MNYSKIYTDLILRFTHKHITAEFELHHIIPRCLGGDDNPNNLIKLPYRYHFFAHLILCKIFPLEPGILLAAYLMSCNKKYGVTSKVYHEMRRNYIHSVSGANNRWYKTSPWFTPMTMHRPDIITTYFYADEIKKLWNTQSNINSGKLRHFIPHENKNAILTLVKLFKNGWVPELDTSWQILKSTFTPIRQLIIIDADKYIKRKDWTSDQVKNFPEKLNIWANADILYEFQMKHDIGYKSIAKAFELDFDSIQSVIVKTTAGWIPDQDSQWAKFKNSVNISPIKLSKFGQLNRDTPWFSALNLMRYNLIDIWVNADKLYSQFQAGENIALNKTVNLHTFRAMNNRFKTGWIPTEDNDWLLFKNICNEKGLTK